MRHDDLLRPSLSRRQALAALAGGAMLPLAAPAAAPSRFQQRAAFNARCLAGSWSNPASEHEAIAADLDRRYNEILRGFSEVIDRDDLRRRQLSGGGPEPDSARATSHSTASRNRAAASAPIAAACPATVSIASRVGSSRRNAYGRKNWLARVTPSRPARRLAMVVRQAAWISSSFIRVLLGPFEGLHDAGPSPYGGPALHRRTIRERTAAGIAMAAVATIVLLAVVGLLILRLGASA
jgi:hypothetical protein